MERAAGIRFVSYPSERGASFTEADMQAVQQQLVGFKDITFVGYSKGATLVENYISYKQKVGFGFGPDVRKFVIAKAPMPGGFLSSLAGGAGTGAPFIAKSIPGVGATYPAMEDFSGGEVVNIYGGLRDVFGTQGYLHGAKSNIFDQTVDRTSGVFTHGSPSNATMRAAYIALNVALDHGADPSLR
jgi:hypothetical protein